jgi:hypothetical protein
MRTTKRREITMINIVKLLYCFPAYGIMLLFIPVFIAAENVYLSPNSKNIVLQKIPCKVNQGVAVDEKYYYAISNTNITKYDKRTFKVIATWQANKQNKAYEHFKHMNSGTVVEGKLYCAHSGYGIDPNDNTVEIWNVENVLLEHEKTIRMPRKYGSLTWIDRHPDGSWWMCYAVYGRNNNKNTKIVKYQYYNKEFIQVKSWFFPKKVINNWEEMSCSGGSWGPDNYLYTTGHDHSKAFVLEIDKRDKIKYIRTENNVGFYGQAIAWDRFAEKPILWGIVKNKYITLTQISNKIKTPWTVPAKTDT